MNGYSYGGGANGVLARVHVHPGTIDNDQGIGPRIPVIFPRMNVRKHPKALAKVDRNNDGTPPTTEAAYAVNKIKGKEAQGGDE